jgi:hypothetical protein
MKKILSIVLWLLCAALAAPGQTSSQRNASLITFTGVPTGSCNSFVFALNTATGDLYDCLAGSWNVIANGSGAAPTSATYITQTSNGVLTNEQALDALATGLLKNTNGTGVLSIGVGDTDYQVPLTFTAPILRAANIISCRTATGSVSGCLSAADWTAFDGKASASITLTAGAGLTGGGDLSANRTFDVGAGTGISVAADSVAVNTTVVPLKSDNLSVFAATTSAQLAGVISDETGSSLLVFNTSPTLVTPVLGVAAGTTLTLTEPVGSSALTLTGAIQTSSFPVLSATQTWNNSGTTFTGIKLNVTNTASAAGSRFLAFLPDATERLIFAWKPGNTNIGFSIHNPNSTSVTALNIGSTNNSLFFGASQGGNSHAILTKSVFTMRSDAFIGWANSTSDASGSQDAAIGRNAAGIVEVNNGSACSTVTNCRDIKVRSTLITGTTSGVVTVTGAAAAGTWTFTLPTTGGTANYALTTDGTGISTWSSGQSIAGLTTADTPQFARLGLGAAAHATYKALLSGTGQVAMDIVSTDTSVETLLTAQSGGGFLGTVSNHVFTLFANGGASGTTIGISTSGAWRAGTDNVQDLGTSALRWSELYINPAASGVGDVYVCLSTAQQLHQGATCAASAARFKENVVTFDHGLDYVMAMRPVEFDYKNDADNDAAIIRTAVDKGWTGLAADLKAKLDSTIMTKGEPVDKIATLKAELKDSLTATSDQARAFLGQSRHSYGMVADELAQIDPRLAVYQDGQIFSIYWDRVTAVLVKALQEEHARVTDLEGRIAILEMKVK